MTEQMTRRRMAAYQRLRLAEQALKGARDAVAAALDADDPDGFEAALAQDRRACVEHDAACAAMDCL